MGLEAPAAAPVRPIVNDVHSGLTATVVDRVVRPRTSREVAGALEDARRQGLRVAVAGGRHAMGGQPFRLGGVLVDTTGLDRVGPLDPERGLVELGAGLRWPGVLEAIRALQGPRAPWGIAQKQTGADGMTLGGSVGANVHGRGLARPPIVDDVEEIELVLPTGAVRRCSRTRGRELFRHVIGGYGLFGVVTSVVLRLAPRRPLERLVEIVDADALAGRFAERIAEGCAFGDFQFAVDARSADFLRRGVFACYRPVAGDPPVPPPARALTPRDWRRLLLLAHVDKSRAFELYAAHYLSTHGQLYWSDEHQLSTYVAGYHGEVDRRRGAAVPGSEVLTELYVPRDRLAGFLAAAADELRGRRADVVYGTVRLIERDALTALAWAREPWACVVLNLHVDHEPRALRRSRDAFRALMDLALALGGTFYLTYHRHATREQLLRGHPALPSVLDRKRRWDPGELLASDWYRHVAGLVG